MAIKTKNIFSKKVLIASILGVALVASGVFLWLASQKKPSTQSSSPLSVNQVNYGGPSDDEQAAGDKQKEVNVQKETPSPQPASGATVILSDASQYGDVIEVRGYIANIIEEGGNCTATFTLGSKVITATGAGIKDAKTTQCSTISLPRSQFTSAGSWSVVLSYKSAVAEGSSTTETVEIK